MASCPGLRPNSHGLKLPREIVRCRRPFLPIPRPRPSPAAVLAAPALALSAGGGPAPDRSPLLPPDEAAAGLPARGGATLPRQKGDRQHRPTGRRSPGSPASSGLLHQSAGTRSEPQGVGEPGDLLRHPAGEGPPARRPGGCLSPGPHVTGNSDANEERDPVLDALAALPGSGRPLFVWWTTSYLDLSGMGPTEKKAGEIKKEEKPKPPDDAALNADMPADAKEPAAEAEPKEPKPKPESSGAAGESHHHVCPGISRLHLHPAGA